MQLADAAYRTAMGFALVGILVALCFAIPAFVMTFFPEHAFRTRHKPRWVGFVLLALSLWLLIYSSMSYFELRQHPVQTKRRAATSENKQERVTSSEEASKAVDYR